jgi:hypothetical protein
MSDFAAARDTAFREILAFARRELRPDDEIQVIDFASVAADRLSATRVADLPAGGLVQVPVPDGTATNLDPVLRLVAETHRSSCDIALLLLSDAQLFDLPPTAPAGLDVLRDAGVHDLVLLVPGDAVEVPLVWGATFPSAAVTRFDGNDADETAVAFGRTVAEVTGQELSSR